MKQSGVFRKPHVEYKAKVGEDVTEKLNEVNY